MTAAGAIWLFSYINTWSIREVGKVQLVTTALKIVPLIIFGTIGFLYFDRGHFTPFNLSGKPAFEAVTATAALRDPANTISRATIVGIAMAALLYISSTVGVMGIIPPAELQQSAAPFADAARINWGPTASGLIAAGAAIACFGALNGWILLQGQIPMAASRDRLFPLVFRKLSSRGVPVPGIFIASILATILVGFNYSRGLVNMFAFIIKLATLSCLLPYLFSSLSEVMLYLRKKKTFNKKRLFSAAAIGSPAFIYSVWAITGLEHEILLYGAILLAAGIPFYAYIHYSSGKS